MPKSWLVVVAMLDLQNLKESSTLPNLPLLLKSKMVVVVFARPKSRLNNGEIWGSGKGESGKTGGWEPRKKGGRTRRTGGGMRG